MAEVNQKALEAVCQANSKFTFNLYQILAEEPGNLFFSPISVQVILALAHFGAKGATAKEIKDGLHLPDDDQLVKDGFNILMNILKGNDDMVLEMANKIYSQATYPVKKEFKMTAEKFMAGAEELDFIKETEKSRTSINQWVEKVTHEKIKDLIPSGVINDLTRLILVNAIYFKGKWSLPFDKAATTVMPFHISLTEKKDVDMMHLKKKFMYADVKELQAQVLELPYKGDQLSMVIILPNKIDGLKELEKNLPSMNLSNILKQMRKVEVNVSLPKFKLEHKVELTKTLKKLGMKTMFEDGKADFSGISEVQPGLVVSHVIHKAFIEVNEEGTEAAAATGMGFMLCMMPPPPVDFQADHPFLFLLRNRNYDTVLFLGRLQF